ncbi:AAA family ATPase [Phormidium sp. CLA17]|uniref:ATP-dependent nuclease n=1 Tax=Leptolyngbya sp. Cla-17 TaxID=2803751 RepID=UPI0014918661|nr:AAA family ATPase [Leptolyngbya sp. Cla-17]MBM0743374.1 AAA family ATPase [Leptolyngbya sp. Cla-17]
MAYNYSKLDEDNLKWFPNDNSCATLRTIKVLHGQIRGLRKATVDFCYPITAIAGCNGSCKTTVLALSACAFHNTSSGFKLSGRKQPYYTFSDFFVQTKEEVALGNIIVGYEILHDRWKGGKAGAAWQHRIKKSGGRWNNYDSRARRTVVFLGVERIVPHSERSVSKSYRGKFKSGTDHGWEDNVREIVGRILGTDYISFSYRRHSKYRLPVVAKKDQKIYSGFNMGAGEHSLFELFSIIYECPDGSLILIDEIELGLHEKAQENLIKELKEVCKKRKFQIICTTHSSRILECLPPESRIFLERSGVETVIIPGISPAYATGKLSGRRNVELDILVEDEAAKLILETVLDKELRSRTHVLPIGSAAAVMRHLAARYKETKHKKDKILEVCVFLDGDKSSKKIEQINLFIKALENPTEQQKSKEWVEERLLFLPGDEWPESWIVKPNDRNPFYERFERELQMSIAEVDDLLDSASRAGKHNEFREAAKILTLGETVVASHLIKSAFDSAPEESQRLIGFIREFLNR